MNISRDPRPWLLVLLCAAWLLYTQPLRAQRAHLETFSLGDGLPSATIYDLAQDGGRVWVESAGSGDGSTFFLELEAAGL